jgi:hypothetical protein
LRAEVGEFKVWRSVVGMHLSGWTPFQERKGYSKVVGLKIWEIRLREACFNLPPSGEVMDRFVYSLWPGIREGSVILLE